MPSKRIFQLAALFGVAFLLVVVSVSAALADGPRPNGLPWATTVPWPTPRPLAVGERWSPSNNSAPVAPPAPIVVPPSSPAPQPVPVSPLPDLFGGADPSSALVADGVLRTLNSGSQVWYRIGVGGVHMSVFLYAIPHANVSMAVYAPNQLHKPIGNGTPYKGDPTQLVWSGGHWNANGIWYALVTNNNPMPIQYRLTSTAQDISNKSCYGYWEYIGTNYVYWTVCE